VWQIPCGSFVGLGQRGDHPLGMHGLGVGHKLSVPVSSVQVQELQTGRTTIAAQMCDLTAAHASAEAEAAAARGQAAGLQAACQAHVIRLEALSAQLSQLQQAHAQVRFVICASDQRVQNWITAGVCHCSRDRDTCLSEAIHGSATTMFLH